MGTLRRKPGEIRDQLTEVETRLTFERISPNKSANRAQPLSGDLREIRPFESDPKANSES